MLTERERCLHQAQALDQVLAAIWRRRVPSQMIQQLKQNHDPHVRRAMEANAQVSQRAANKASRMLLTYREMR